MGEAPEALVIALQNKKVVNITYTKGDGTTSTYTGGIYEIGYNKANNPSLWLWVDSPPNPESPPGIRNLLLSNINTFEVLDIDFIDTQGFPFKLWGSIIG